VGRDDFGAFQNVWVFLFQMGFRTIGGSLKLEVAAV